MRTQLAVLTTILLCVAAAPPKVHPLDLVVPAPNDAVHLAWYTTTPDETVAEKIASLERAARLANPNAAEWSIYLSPTAALMRIKGWQAEMNRPDTPLPEATLRQCLEWLSDTAGLRFEVVESRVLLDLQEKK